MPGRFHAELLARYLCKKSFDVKIYSSTPKFYFSHDLRDKVIFVPMVLQILRKITGKKIPNILHNLEFSFFDWVISRFMRKPDIVYGFAGVSKFCGSRYSNTLYILDRACPHIEFQTNLMKRESKKLGLSYEHDSRIKERMKVEYELADKIFIPSEYTKSSFQKYANLSHKTYLTNLDGKVVPSEEITNCANFTIGYLGGDNIIRKGLYYLLKAFDDDSESDVTLLIRASDSSILSSEELIQIVNSRENIVFKKRYEKIEDFYKEIDVLCVPSVDEGWGMVVLEALANGVPVICTSNVGSSVLIKEGVNGFVLDPYDFKSIREKVYYLEENKDELALLKKNSYESYNDFIQSGQSYYDRLDNSILFD